nr:GntR family transcriptional regulator [Sphingomonas sp.]
MTQGSDLKDRVLAEIAAARLGFGAQLTLDDLAARYDAGHTPIREAALDLQGASRVGDRVGLKRADEGWIQVHRRAFSTRAAIEMMKIGLR